jgi:repressor LexA
MVKLHKNQEKILTFIKQNNGDLSGFSLRAIGQATNLGERPQIISHHIFQLEKKGFLREIDKKNKKYLVLDNPIPEIAYINLYGMAECGPNGFFAENMIAEKIPLPTKTFGIYNTEDFFLVTARGKSMEPLIREGDLVLSHKQPMVDSGNIAVVLHDDIPKIKKVVVSNIGGKMAYSLISLNNEFKDEVVKNEEGGLFILGLVKKIIQSPKTPNLEG